MINEAGRSNCLIIILLFIWDFSTSAQGKYDYQWPFAYDFTFATPGFEGVLLDFNNGEVSQRLYTDKTDLSNSVAAICDPYTGELILYTNGCDLRNADHDVIENGDDIPNGYLSDRCDSENRYPFRFAAYLLPDNYKDSCYYMIYFEINSVPQGKWMEYCYIDMTANGGKGTVLAKSKRIVEAGDFAVGYRAISIADNDRDWILVAMSKDTNRVYTVIIDEAGPRLDTIQYIGNPPVTSIGNSKISPDKKKLLYFDAKNGLSIFDFNHSNGILSNYKYIPIIQPDHLTGLNGFVEFSANSQYGYFGASKFLYQIDMATYEYELIAYADTLLGDSFLDRNFGDAQRGPDCKIYIAPASGSKMLHVIHEPNQPGQACDFRQQSLRLLSYRPNSSMAYHPSYEYARGYVCDDTITDVAELEGEVTTVGEISIYPNPSSGLLYIESQSKIEHIYIYDRYGSQVHSQEYEITDGVINIDITDRPSGLYFIKATMNGEMVTTKFIKI